MDVSSAIDKLFTGVVPDRVEELKETWGEQAERVRLQEGAGFLMQQVYGTVQVNELALKQIWFICFAAWKAIDSYAGILRLLKSQQLPLDIRALGQAEGQSELDAKFDEAMRLAETLKSCETFNDFDWPNDVPFPQEGMKFDDPTEKAIFDLVCMAGGYIFLHEIRHAQLWKENLSPEDALEEELECDAYARRIMLDKVSDYAGREGFPENLVIAKRVLGILLAKLVILAITPRHLWSDSTDHPAVKDRIKTVLEAVTEPAPDWFWSTCAALLLAFGRYYRLIEGTIAFSSCRELALTLCDKFSGLKIE